MEATRPETGYVGSFAEQRRAGREAVLTLNVFLDSSALAKRYVVEPGSDRVEEILLGASSLGVSVLCLPEVLSALCRRRRERLLSRAQYVRAKQALLKDIGDSSVINITDRVVARATELLERWPLPSSDAIHVASAAEWAAELFVSADDRQCATSRAYGLHVEVLRGA